MSMRNKLKGIHRLFAGSLPASTGGTAIGTIRTALTCLNFNVIIFFGTSNHLNWSTAF